MARAGRERADAARAEVKILYVEDDPEAREFVCRALRDAGYDVEAAARAAEGRELAERGGYDLLILDVGLPDGSGFELLESLRAQGFATPALFLTARGEVSLRIRGLDLGADDYLTKPFALAELQARIRALARRASGQAAGTTLRVADLVVDEEAHRVERCGQRIDLAPKEFTLLSYLMRHAGHVVSRSMIVEKVWGYGFEAHDNVIDVHVNRLRKKVDRGFDAPLIHTVKGIGYVVEERSESGESG